MRFARSRVRRVAALAAVLVLGAVAARPAFPYGAVQNKADNTEIRIVPAPGKVVIDGRLDDWDRSGEIFMFVDEGSRDTLSLTAAMMYDRDALYIDGQWIKPATGDVIEVDQNGLRLVDQINAIAIPAGSDGLPLEAGEPG